MKICYIDHSFHQKTLSTQFVAEILRKHGHEVDFYWDDSWQGGKSVCIDDLVGAYDTFIFFQLAARSSKPYYKLPINITFIPMLDSYGNEYSLHHHRMIWKQFAGVKVLNFSKALHCAAASHGLASKYFKYFPDPSQYEMSEPEEILKGFLWQRHPEAINWHVVKKIAAATHFGSFHLHMPVDPFHAQVYPDQADIDRYGITVTDWFKERDDYYSRVQACQVYFAPRPSEGIGMSFLEAMAMGKCVVTPDCGTMNEYIVDRVNGLLYDLSEPRALDFSRAAEIGKMARYSVETGFDEWRRREAELVDYIVTPRDIVYRQLYTVNIDYSELAAAQPLAGSLATKCRLRLVKFKQRVGKSRLRPWLNPVWQRIKKVRGKMKER